jgi:hypothetical protein
MRHVVAVLVSAALFAAVAAAGASGRSGLTTNPAHTVAYFPEFTITNEAAALRCPVDLELSLHQSIPKVIGALAGFLDMDIYEEQCEGGTIGLLSTANVRTTALVRLHVTYEGFEGTLPNINSIALLTRPRIWYEEVGGFVICLTFSNLTFVTTGGNPVTGLSINQSVGGWTNIGGFFCPEPVVFEGTASLFAEKEHEQSVSVELTLI